jgi:glyoxylase-like metal-dependent hydrolase (beta-lactamase superfamily II)
MEAVSRYLTSSGCKIYAFPVRAFPELVANIYFISDGQQRILVDCGSGMERSNRDLLAGLKAIEERYGEPAGLEKLSAILITHGHIDHFGGLPFVREYNQAPIGVHLLDRRILSHYEDRVVVASRLLENFLKRAGVLASDHVLSRTTPHQAPESITNNMGLGHYLDSLDKIQALDGIRLALGGHEEAMDDLSGCM